MPLTEFIKKLENDLNKSVKLKINNNRSTMLSVKWGAECTKVSMHRFFLDAPSNVMDELACYIKKEHSTMTPSVKSFIEESVQRMDYTHILKKDKLEVVGKHYNLQALMDRVNEEYFQGVYDLHITWFQGRRRSVRSQFTFGLYHAPLKLVKINRLLDRADIPEFILSFVIYHEMLHHVVPSYCDEKGIRKIHNKEFKSMEKQFREYDRAKLWIEENRERLFRMR